MSTDCQRLITHMADAALLAYLPLVYRLKLHCKLRVGQKTQDKRIECALSGALHSPESTHTHTHMRRQSV